MHRISAMQDSPDAKTPHNVFRATSVSVLFFLESAEGLGHFDCRVPFLMKPMTLSLNRNPEPYKAFNPEIELEP